MASFNRVILLGNLTRDAELRYAPGSNTPVARTAIAVNYKTRDKDETMFIDITVFGRQAEVLSSYATKGTRLLIEGRLSQSTWQQDGQKRSKHEIIVNSFKFLSSKKDAGRPTEPTDFPDVGDDEDIPF